MVSYIYNQPLEQFSIHIVTLINTNYSYVLYLFVLIGLFVGYFYIYFLNFFESRFMLFINNLIKMIINIYYQQIINVHILLYFPLIFSICIFILFSNLYGLFPYGFTISSHIWLTASLAISIFIGITLIGFINSGLNFLKFFIPAGVTNKILLYFLIFIEIISYMIRPLSLAIRLFANMLAGHTLLYILLGSALVVSKTKIYFLVFLPLLIIFLVIFLEIGIAFIQTYVFVILILIYFIDVYTIGH